MSLPYPFEGLRPAHYKAILADPPWQWKGFTPFKKARRDTRLVEKHYDVMDRAAIARLPVRQIAAEDCHLFLWATGPCLEHAFEVMRAWGFKYSGIAFTWVKVRRGMAVPIRLVENNGAVLALDDLLHVGLGFTTRKNAEFVLLGRRGNPHRNGKDVREVIVSPVREHSRKPDEVHSRIARYCDGPYLELFARETRAGWTTWGDQLDKFDSASTSRSVTSIPRAQARRRKRRSRARSA